MQSEIGSNFWLSPDDVIGSNVIPSPDIFNCAGSDYVWLSTCRSAIELVIRTIEQRNPNVKKVVWSSSIYLSDSFRTFREGWITRL